MNCQVCHDGTLQAGSIEQWLRRNDSWVLFRNVEALVCDTCGEVALTEQVAGRLATLAQSEIRTGSFYFQVCDLQQLDRGTAASMKPSGTAPNPTSTFQPLYFGGGAVGLHDAEQVWTPVVPTKA